METKKFVVVNGTPLNISVEDEQIVEVGQEKVTPKIEALSNSEFNITLKGKTFKGEIVKLKQNTCTVLINGNSYDFVIETEKSFLRSEKLKSTNTDTSVKIKAPLPGAICEVSVELNQVIQKGDALLTLEAMKMQNEILSPVSGKITKLNIKANESVFKDQIMIEIDTRG